MPDARKAPSPALEDIDRIIHEPARLMIVRQLYVLEAADFPFIQRETGLTQGNLSSHMAKLESAGLVEVIKEFADKRPRTLLRLTTAGRTAFEDYVATMKRLLLR